MIRIRHKVAIVLAGLFVTGLTGQASAEQRPADCVAAVRDRPSLDAKRLPGLRFRMVTDVIGWYRDKSGEKIELTLRHGEEAAELKDGVALRVTQGGCETYGNRYEFSFSKPPPANADGAYWLRKTSELLLEIAPANMEPGAFPLQKLARTLARKAQDPKVARTLLKDGLEGQLKPGPYASTYDVEVEQRAGKTVLTVGYGSTL